MNQRVFSSFAAAMLTVAAAAAMLTGGALMAPALHAQEYGTPYGPSSQDAVDRMIEMAELKEGDVVADLGSGNGQIIIAAVRSNPKVTGWGVDIQDWLVQTATDEAAKQGVSDRAVFTQRNAFDVDLREADVINMWLFANLTRLLQPKILAEARPGTRVIVNGQLIGTDNILGNWQPDVIDRSGSNPIMKWYVPAKVAGYWTWTLPLAGTNQTYDVIMSQQYQVAEGFARVGNRRESLTDVKLRGENLSFVFELTLTGIGRTRHEFTGRVSGDWIEGKVVVAMPEGKSTVLPWVARRTPDSGYFRPTGLDFK